MAGSSHMRCLLTLSLLALFTLLLSVRLIRDVSATNGPNVNYVALGDSITSGFFAGNNAYVVLYENYLAADLGVTVSLHNLGVSGWTSSDLVLAVFFDSTYRSQLQGADIVTIMIGYNDFYSGRLSYINNTCGGADNQDCLRNTVTTFRSNFSATLSEIQSLNTKLTLRVADNYYSQIASDYANGWGPVLNPYLSQLNNYIRDEAAVYGYAVANVHQAYNGVGGLDDPIVKGYILQDNVHPTNLGFQVIADQFRSLGYAPLNSPTATATLTPT